MPFPQNRYLAGAGGTKPFLLRQVITTGYVLAGYQNSSPWTNVNEVTHSTDTTIDKGNVLNNSSGYPGGMCDDTFAYLLKANNGVGGSGTNTNKYNMRTNSSVTGPSSPYNVGNSGTIMHKEQSYAYGKPFDGSAAIMRFNFATQSWMSSLSASYGTNGGSGGSAVYHENVGWHYGDGNGTSAGVKFTFATETQSTGTIYGAHGQQKGISSKRTYLYTGNEGDYAGGYNLRRWNVATESNVGNVSKPIGNCGEENFDMGQDWQFMLGNYNGSQNNRSWRWNYTTDSGYEGGSGMQSKGVGGRSSAYSAQRS
jgi:hypothetical protein